MSTIASDSPIGVYVSEAVHRKRNYSQHKKFFRRSIEFRETRNYWSLKSHNRFELGGAHAEYRRVLRMFPRYKPEGRSSVRHR